MLVTLDGIDTDVNPLYAKASSPMLVTLDGIVTEVSPLQLKNAERPMLVTLDGIVTAPPAPLYLVSTPPLISKSARGSEFTVTDFVAVFVTPPSV